MKNNTIVKQPEVESGEVLQLTALLYFNEALVNQEYESCTELIAIAKGLGVSQSEISEVISNSLFGRKTSASNEVKKGNNRLGLLKEE